MSPIMLKTSEASEYMGVSIGYLRKLIRDGELEAICIGNGSQRPTYRIEKGVIDEWKTKRRTCRMSTITEIKAWRRNR
jgi:excisionase family DNA binding protein